MRSVTQIYRKLLAEFGPQGWWPLLECNGTNPTKTGAIKGYHPGDHTYPRTEQQVFEVCIGAILTQNTSWANVEKALQNLNLADALKPARLLSLGEDELKRAILPAGYYNQKARKLRYFASFFTSIKGRVPNRRELLEIWGIGPETADSILCYAYHQPVFVVDAYTKRICSRIGIREEAYEDLQRLFQTQLTESHTVLNEAHALLVELGKRHCTKRKPLCSDCPLLEHCVYGKRVTTASRTISQSRGERAKSKNA